MTEDIPFIDFDANSRPKPCTWAEYAELISHGMCINEKYNVMGLLKACMDWTLDSSKCPGIWETLPPERFPPEQILDLKSIVAVQIMSLAYELTENLAAVCYACAEAVDHGVQYFPVLVRDFGMPMGTLKKKYGVSSGVDIQSANADRFYSDAVTNDSVLKRYLGTSSMTAAELDDIRDKFKSLSSFRDRFERWYNKYKHAHAVVPVKVNGTMAGQPFEWHLIHRVPDYLNHSDAQVAITEQVLPPQWGTGLTPTVENESFLSAMELVEDAHSAGQVVLQVWQAVRNTQHLKLFGKVPN